MKYRGVTGLGEEIKNLLQILESYKSRIQFSQSCFMLYISIKPLLAHLQISHFVFCIFVYNYFIVIMLQEVGPNPSTQINFKLVPFFETAADSSFTYDLIKSINRKNRQKPVSISKGRTQRWNPQQNKIYAKFLEENAHLFRYKSVRRVRQIFMLLSEKMGGRRTPAQCKSHHQKMGKATEKGTIKQILSYIRQKYIGKQGVLGTQKKKIETICAKDNQIVITKQKSKCTQINVKINLNCLQIW